MDKIMDIVKMIQAHWADAVPILAYIIAAASVIVKLTPTLKDDSFLLPIVKFIGKYIALNVNVSSEDRPK